MHYNIICTFIAAIVVVVYALSSLILFWGVVPLLFKIALDLICMGSIQSLFNINLGLGIIGYFLVLFLSEDARDLFKDLFLKYSYYFLLYAFGSASMTLITGGDSLDRFISYIEERIKENNG